MCRREHVPTTPVAVNSVMLKQRTHKHKTKHNLADNFYFADANKLSAVFFLSQDFRNRCKISLLIIRRILKF